MDSPAYFDVSSALAFLKKLLLKRLPPPSHDWLLTKLTLLETDPAAKNLYLFFGAAPRFITEEVLVITEEEQSQAKQLREGWYIKDMTSVQASRILAVLSYSSQPQESFFHSLEQLFTTAEMNELVALYRALPLLPYAPSFKLRAAEGIRTNMSVVFDAIALHNPYTHDYLDDDAWNQMILKALFMDRPLFKIWGIDNRSNYSLSKMISDFAHERWAAGRDTSPEMWRPIKKDPSEAIYDDLRKLLLMEDPIQQAAAVLAARALNTPSAKSLLEEFEATVSGLDANTLNWQAIGKRWRHLKKLSSN